MSRERSFVPVAWVVALALASLKLSAIAHAVNSPPDGGYPDRNTAEGEDALLHVSTGYGALFSNTAGSANTATGLAALAANTTGHDNTASGVDALFLNTTGLHNTADGSHALFNNTTGSNNIALGNNAGSLVTGSNNIDIGAQGAAGESGVIRIGISSSATGTFIAGISGKTVAAGVGVMINPKGQLGTEQSSARFKDDIKPMDKASESILFLQPVTFRYKHDLDSDGIPQFGLVAEQVERVNPDLVVRGEDGKVMTVRYEAVNAMLLNEFLKEHRKVEGQQAMIAELKSSSAKQAMTIAQQQKQIEALTATVRKVSERVELSALALQIAANAD